MWRMTERVITGLLGQNVGDGADEQREERRLLSVPLASPYTLMVH